MALYPVKRWPPRRILFQAALRLLRQATTHNSGMAVTLEREEYIEQAYFFRVFRERGWRPILSAQELLDSLHEELLSTTRLPMALQFLSTELKHSGLLSSGMERLAHYFTPYQSFVIRQTEDEKLRFSTDLALLVLEREAQYRASQPIAQGLFVYQFETISRNRLGYDDGLKSMTGDPFYSQDWRDFLEWVRRQVGVTDFSDMVYWRSQVFVKEQRRKEPAYVPSLPPLFDEKEGRIASANRGRDPLYMFAALQRQPNTPKCHAPGRATTLLQARSLASQVRNGTAPPPDRRRLRDNIDITKLGKPELLKDDGEVDGTEEGNRIYRIAILFDVQCSRHARVTTCPHAERTTLLSCRSVAPKRPQDFIEVGRNADLVFQEVLEPQIVLPMGDRNEGQ